MFLVPIAHPGITLRRITHAERFHRILRGVPRRGGRRRRRRRRGGRTTAGRWRRGSFITNAGRSGRARSSPAAAAARAATRRRSTTPTSPRRPGQADNERVHEMAGRALVHRAVAEQLIGHVYRSVRDGATAAGRRNAHQALPLRDRDPGDRHRAGDRGSGRCRGGNRRRSARPGCGTCPGRRSPSAAAQRRWPATSSGSGCWNFPREYAADRGVPFNQVRHGKVR